MDSEDIPLLAQLTGRNSPQADPAPPSDSQLMAQVLRRYIDANPLPGQQAPAPVDPEQMRQSQEYAAALERYSRSLQTGEPIPASPKNAPPGGAGLFARAPLDPTGAGFPGPAAPSPADLSSFHRTPPAQNLGVQLLSDTISADPQHGLSFLRPTPTPQPPSAQTQAAARDELQRRDLTPNADYIDAENDALANLARGRVAPSWEYPPPLKVAPGPSNNPAPPERVIGSHGYTPMPEDENTLARLIFAEGGASEDFPAIGWSIVNRVGLAKFGKTLKDVGKQPQAFSSVDKGGSPQYRLSAHPSEMDPISAAKWQRAQQVAHDLMNGLIPDPTGGGQFFFASDHYNGDPQTAPGYYKKALKNMHAGPYQGHADASGNKTSFFIENPEKKTR